MSGRVVGICGATGFTGRLVAAALRGAGFEIAVAGRDRVALEQVAAEVGGRPVTARIDDAAALEALAADVDLIVTCAGPFVDLGAPVVEAALRGGAHIFDLAGEQAWLAACESRYDAEARDRGLVIANAMGAEGALADCAAMAAAEDLEAVRAVRVVSLAEGFRSSPATRRSALRVAARGGWAMIGGRRVRREAGANVRRVDLGPPHERRWAAWMPTVEILTLARQLPGATIDAYIALPAPVVLGARLGGPAVRRLAAALEGAADRLLARGGDPGPARTDCRFLIRAEVEGDGGRRIQVVVGRDAYATTALIVAEAARRLLADGPAAGRGGVLAPGQVVSPRPFLAALAARGAVTLRPAVAAGSPPAV